MNHCKDQNKCKWSVNCYMDNPCYDCTRNELGFDQDQDYFKKQTNADRIRAMSDEELFDMIVDFKNGDNQVYNIWQWLKQEVE